MSNGIAYFQGLTLVDRQSFAFGRVVAANEPGIDPCPSCSELSGRLRTERQAILELILVHRAPKMK